MPSYQPDLSCEFVDKVSLSSWAKEGHCCDLNVKCPPQAHVFEHLGILFGKVGGTIRRGSLIGGRGSVGLDLMIDSKAESCYI